ncbi:MAG: hypothetical protein WCR55_01285 [Lentisphaerota bacterium]
MNVEQGFLFEDMTELEKSASLKITSKNKKTLSKEQQAFNRLTKRVETLENEMLLQNEKLTKLNISYSKEIAPLLSEKAQNDMKLAMTLGNATKFIKFTKTKLDDLTDVILNLCDSAFKEIPATPEMEIFYEEWSKVNYKDEVEKQKNEFKDELQDLMKDICGVDINMDDFDDNSESFARLADKFQDEVRAKKQKKVKKNKKQLQREEAEKAEAEIKKKSIRNIYITLSKLLHPDTELDPKLKAQKDEIMKKVTVAYKNKDLTALLKLELEFVHKESEHLDKITEANLRIYVSALKEQVKNLEREMYMVRANPRYRELAELISLPENAAVFGLSKKAKNIKAENNKVLAQISEFEKPHPKKPILAFVEKYFNNHPQCISFDSIMESFFMRKGRR